MWFSFTRAALPHCLPIGARWGFLISSTAARELTPSAFLDGQIIDHFSATRRLSRNADCIFLVLTARDEAVKNDLSILDRHIDMLVVKVGICVKSRLHPRCQFLVRLHGFVVGGKCACPEQQRC